MSETESRLRRVSPIETVMRCQVCEALRATLLGSEGS